MLVEPIRLVDSPSGFFFILVKLRPPSIRTRGWASLFLWPAVSAVTMLRGGGPEDGGGALRGDLR
jgi:hypothetical protein